MEYPEIQTELSEISLTITGTGFIDSLTEQEKWNIYERFKQRIQFFHPDEYEQILYEASNILEI